MGRIIEYEHLDHELRLKLHKNYPGGITENDILHFEKPGEGWVSAVELPLAKETYLVKYSLTMKEKLEDYTIEDIERPEELGDDYAEDEPNEPDEPRD